MAPISCCRLMRPDPPPGPARVFAEAFAAASAQAAGDLSHVRCGFHIRSTLLKRIVTCGSVGVGAAGQNRRGKRKRPALVGAAGSFYESSGEAGDQPFFPFAL